MSTVVRYVDEVSAIAVPVVLGAGNQYFGSVRVQLTRRDPDVVIEGNQVLNPCCAARPSGSPA